MALRTASLPWLNIFFYIHLFLGTQEVQDEMCLPASEALVFMVVSINGGWKLSIGYFFITHLQSEEKAKLVEIALKKLHDVGVKTLNTTCDCPSTNWAALRHLGAVFDPENLKPSFQHPSNPDEEIQVILDPSHLVKLVRNALSDLGTIYDSDGNPIK